MKIQVTPTISVEIPDDLLATAPAAPGPQATVTGYICGDCGRITGGAPCECPGAGTDQIEVYICYFCLEPIEDDEYAEHLTLEHHEDICDLTVDYLIAHSFTMPA